ncbi:hypothetical protein OHU11_04325 [Streptomyces sp. NBC_00257]|nr:hypothetical protein [Streptomyces sp. NBC_00906]MCX4901698.1 hypothetical protein [Streptomyces sp. NBC_00892]MCX5426940.1 hypothetical protein [Streptomyces sp. NBC_00062]
MPTNHGLVCVVSAHTGQIRAILDDQGLLTAWRTAAPGAPPPRALWQPTPWPGPPPPWPCSTPENRPGYRRDTGQRGNELILKP